MFVTLAVSPLYLLTLPQRWRSATKVVLLVESSVPFIGEVGVVVGRRRGRRPHDVTSGRRQYKRLLRQPIKTSPFGDATGDENKGPGSRTCECASPDRASTRKTDPPAGSRAGSSPSPLEEVVVAQAIRAEPSRATIRNGVANTGPALKSQRQRRLPEPSSTQ